MNYKQNKAVIGVAVALISFFGINAIGVKSALAVRTKCVQYNYDKMTGMKGSKITAEYINSSACAARISNNSTSMLSGSIWVDEG
jgi:hypothetical protein